MTIEELVGGMTIEELVGGHPDLDRRALLAAGNEQQWAVAVQDGHPAGRIGTPMRGASDRVQVVETLSLFMPLLVWPEAPPPPEGLIRWLRATGLSSQGPVDDGSEHLAWVERWSAPLAELDPPVLENALRVTPYEADGYALLRGPVSCVPCFARLLS